MSNDAITNANPGDPRPATIFGIDSHARTTTICALVVATGEAVTRTFRGNDYADMSGWMAGFPAPARGVYEAGCTGFVPARLLSGGSVAVVVTAATFVSEVPDVGAFASAAKLAAYAGLAPRVRQSGRSLNSVTRPRAGNRRLKRALVLSAARSVDFCEESRAYYDRKRSEGRCHYSAAVALARRRINVMYAMLRDGKRYESRPG